jgi:hypothetical protein
MKKRRTILIVGAVLAMLLAAALVNASSSPITPSSVAPVSMSGGGYILVTQPVSTTGALTGGHYQLVPSKPTVDPASGCCCKTNLPCVMRQ